MSKIRIEDLRFSSSSIDDFWMGGPSLRTASGGRVRIASLEQLGGFHFASNDTLVHLSQRDFWKLAQDEEGFYIERLVDDSEGPIKES